MGKLVILFPLGFAEGLIRGSQGNAKLESTTQRCPVQDGTAVCSLGTENKGLDCRCFIKLVIFPKARSGDLQDLQSK